MTQLLEEAIAQLRKLPQAEQNKIAAMIMEQLESSKKGFWDELDEVIEECKISTGIEDLSYQHDHYIHGTPKRDVQ